MSKQMSSQMSKGYVYEYKGFEGHKGGNTTFGPPQELKYYFKGMGRDTPLHFTHLDVITFGDAELRAVLLYSSAYSSAYSLRPRGPEHLDAVLWLSSRNYLGKLPWGFDSPPGGVPKGYRLARAGTA